MIKPINMFSKSCEYGTRAALYLATLQEDRKLGVAELAEILQVPRHFLAKILQQLSKNNLISSQKGPNGGFFMTDDNLKSDLLSVIISIDGPDVFNRCVLGLPECSSTNPCSFHDKTVEYRKSMLEILQEEPISTTAEKIVSQNLKI